MAGPHDRRTVLRSGSIAALATLAGCATLQAELGVRTERLGRVVLANSIEDPFEVEIEIVRDGATVYEATHHLTAGSSEERPQIVIDEWDADPEAREWEVRARTTTSEWRTAELDAAVGEPDDCHEVTVVTGDWPETPILVLAGDCEPAGTKG